MGFKNIESKMDLPKMEGEVLKFWEENKIFEKSISTRADSPLYTFYDGPPFATGLPHYGHIVASTMKDVVPRYWTMKGYRVPRKWGWDCHGLPIENIVEKELGFKSKKDIEAIGVEKFNALCRSKVLGYVEEWKRVINRLGRWADMENSYKTMDLPFMESVWWVFKELYDRGLIYEGYRSMHICPRCETTLSQSEVAEGYKMVKDLSAMAKFELVETQDLASLRGEGKTYVLAWTTTPWTLIGNVALAIKKDINYIILEKSKEEKIIVGYDIKILHNVFGKTFNETRDSHPDLNELPKYIISEKGVEYKVVGSISGVDLVGKKYKPLFDYYSKDEKLKNRENGWKIYAGDFVTTEEGTGVVHIAPAFGEDDMNLGKKYSLPFIQHVGMDGVIKDEAKEFAGLHVKPLGDTQSTDVEIIKYLAHHDLLFAKEKYEHPYPHCWRCDTPLINYATTSWFVNISKFKERMIELSGDINWSPEHIKDGRWGNWLDSARDWSISRQRFWASVMPIWKCEECHEIKVIGSVKELENLSGKTVTDLHKDVVDKITFGCNKCSGEMRRIPDVLDTWFDSGSMPYAQSHYPFENKEQFEEGFPAEFIAEGVDQTRAWFYYLHVIASAIVDSRAFNNVVVNGIVLAEDGKKMAKRLQNYPDPTYIFDKYGADPLRYYLLSSPVMQAENLNFKEADVAELVRGIFRMLWNSYSFFVLYANIDGFIPSRRDAINRVSTGENLLDKWIISELQILIKEVNRNMESYELTRAARLFPRFIDNLSNWYIRRSRRRFWKSESDTDKKEAYETLHYVLVTLAKLMAPFTPFIAEEIYRNLALPSPPAPLPSTGEGGVTSVHLADFPVADEKLIDEKLNCEMAEARNIITEALQLRAKAKIKVRQPLSELFINQELRNEFLDIVKEEVNIKKVTIDKILENVKLDTEITEELKLEGVAREIIRHIQEMRKEAGYQVDNHIKVCYSGWSEVFSKFGDLIARETLADSKVSSLDNPDLEKKFVVEGREINISIKKT